MRLEKTKNTIRNMAFGIITRIIQIIFPFVIRTAFIYTLGIEYLGLNSLFTSILSVLSLTELGVGSALVFSMYKPLAEGDIDAVCALMNLYRKCYYAIGTVIGVVGICLIPFLPHLITGSIPAEINLYVIYLMNLFGTVITYFLFAYKNCILEVYQRNDISSKITIILSFIQYGIQISILLVLKNYYCYLIVAPIISIIRNCVTAIIVNKKYSQYKPYGKVAKDIVVGIKKRISALVMYKIGSIVLNSVDNIVISAFLGLSVLAVYNNYYYIITSLFGFMSIITSSMLAGVGNSVVTDSVEKNYKDLKKFLFMQLWITGWCAITLFCLYQNFMYIWVGKDLMFSTTTVLLMVILFYAWKIGDIVGLYKEALGMWYEDRFRPLIGAGVNLIVNLILVRIIGIDGVIISSIMCIIAITFPIAAYILFKKYFQRSPKEFYWMQIKHFLIITVCGMITYGLCNLLNDISIIGFFIKMLICVIVPNILLILFYHKNEQFQEAKIFIFKILRRRKE